MDNNNTTREQLIAELEKLRQRTAQLETLEVEHRLSLEVGHSEERLAGIIASITDHMSMMDEDHNIVWANTIAYDLFGSDLVGRKCYSAYHGYDKPCDACLVSKCFHDGEVHEHETKIIGADGTPMTFWCTASVAERNSNGRPKLVVEISRDITDRKRAEQDLRQYRLHLEKLVSERTAELQNANEQLQHEINERRRAEVKVREMANRFKTIFDSVNDVLTVIDKHHTVTEANRYRLAVSGLTRQQVIGKKCYEVFQRQDTPCEICPAMPVFGKGEPVRLEKPVVAKDGTVKYFDAQGTPIFDDEGNVVEVISSARDITEKKQAEKALMAAARQWQTTFDAISDGVCLLERNRKILRCNKAMTKILGISPDEIIGATCWEVVHGATEPVEECPIVRMYETHRRATRVLTIDNRWYNVSVDPVLTESGEIAGAVHIMSNITSQKEAEEVKRKLATELQEVRKMQAIGTLAGGIAHDFNNRFKTALNSRGSSWDTREKDDMRSSRST
ncbi:MAG: PAS domain S-box protein [Deltaproteobacteria bacterium]|nr:PAS domain S-box protein [Deltaproteobacteria bacterium]